MACVAATGFGHQPKNKACQTLLRELHLLLYVKLCMFTVVSPRRGLV